jgi:murein DD-endopeptidase MepM/ murein hydrolase activator NlpD
VRQIAAKYNIINDKSSEIEVEGALQRIVNTNLLEVDFEGDKAIPRIVEGQKLIIPDGVILPEPEKVAVVPKSTTAPKSPTSVNQTKLQTIVEPVTVIGGKLPWPVAGNKGLITDVFRPPVHPATDIADRSSPYVVAVADGTVKYAGWSNGGGGWVLDVEFDNGFLGHYAHTCCDTKRNTYLVKAGDRVVTGQALATMGSTGRSTGPHLHFSLYDIKNRKYVNPTNYISR